MSSDLCFPVDNPISSLYSTWRSCKRDRIWSFTCQDAGGDKKCSEWTDWVNEWDGPLFKICDKNGYISGVYSEHDNGKEDRRRVTRLTLLSSSLQICPLLFTPLTSRKWNWYPEGLRRGNVLLRLVSYFSGAILKHYRYFYVLRSKFWLNQTCQN